MAEQPRDLTFVPRRIPKHRVGADDSSVVSSTLDRFDNLGLDNICAPLAFLDGDDGTERAVRQGDDEEEDDDEELDDNEPGVG